MIYLFIAPGVAEMEAVTTLDILRRAELDVRAVGVGDKSVTGARGVTVLCDITDDEAVTDGLEMVILPGGKLGALNLEHSKFVTDCLKYANANDLWIGAICAAPSVMGHLGMLEGKTVTCYPGFETELGGATYSTERVVRDGKLITGKGPGASIEFALEIVRALCGEERASRLKESLQ